MSCSRTQHGTASGDQTQIQSPMLYLYVTALPFICMRQDLHPIRPYEPPQGKANKFAYAKTKAQISFAVTAKLISAFVFATRVVQFLFYLNLKFQASSSFLCLYRSVCVRPVRKPHCWFSHKAAHILDTVVAHRFSAQLQFFDTFLKAIMRMKH